LPATRQPCPNLVTGSTRQLLRRIMISVTEANSISRRLLRSAHQAPELMADAARGNIAAVCLCVGRMTAKAGDVRIQPRWNREPDATAITTMASSTSGAGMLCMIEPGVETAQRRKRFDLTALHVRVTDSTNCACRIGELRCVTACARRMVRFTR